MSTSEVIAKKYQSRLFVPEKNAFEVAEIPIHSMSWSAIAGQLYFDDDSLSVIVCEPNNMTPDKWKLLCAFLQKNYGAVMRDNKESSILLDFSLLGNMEFDGEACRWIAFHIQGVLFHMHFYEEFRGSEIFEFDFFPRDVDTHEKHNSIFALMEQLVDILKIPVKLTSIASNMDYTTIGYGLKISLESESCGSNPQ